MRNTFSKMDDKKLERLSREVELNQAKLESARAELTEMQTQLMDLSNRNADITLAMFLYNSKEKHIEQLNSALAVSIASREQFEISQSKVTAVKSGSTYQSWLNRRPTSTASTVSMVSTALVSDAVTSKFASGKARKGSNFESNTEEMNSNVENITKNVKLVKEKPIKIVHYTIMIIPNNFIDLPMNHSGDIEYIWLNDNGLVNHHVAMVASLSPDEIWALILSLIHNSLSSFICWVI